MGMGEPDETVPGPNQAGDDFVAPGGFPMPEHLAPQDLGHLLGSSLVSLAAFAEITAKGEVPDAQIAGNARTAKSEILRTVDYLLGRYGADIDAVQGLREFLVQFRLEVAQYRWEEAVQTYRRAKQDFHF